MSPGRKDWILFAKHDFQATKLVFDGVAGFNRVQQISQMGNPPQKRRDKNTIVLETNS